MRSSNTATFPWKKVNQAYQVDYLAMTNTKATCGKDTLSMEYDMSDYIELVLNPCDSIKSTPYTKYSYHNRRWQVEYT